MHAVDYMASTFDAEDSPCSLDRDFFSVLSEAYSEFLSGVENFPGLGNELEEKLKSRDGAVQEEMDQLIKEMEGMQQELTVLDENHPPLEALEADHHTLRSDRDKFQHYIDSVERKKSRLQTMLVGLHQETEGITAGLEEARRVRAELMETVEKQPISTSDLERMKAELESLSHQYTSALETREELERNVSDMEIALTNQMDRVERAVRDYNLQVDLLGLGNPESTLSSGTTYTLSVNMTAARPEDIPSLSLRGSIRVRRERERERGELFLSFSLLSLSLSLLRHSNASSLLLFPFIITYHFCNAPKSLLWQDLGTGCKKSYTPRKMK